MLSVSRHKEGSQSAILLTRWLNEDPSDQLAAMLGPGQVTVADWMILALSQMSGQMQANKAGQAFVQKLLEIGDIHTAASILLAMGDSNDAIEVYVSQYHFMEAILMTCLLMPTDWQRQSYLVRRWGEFVVSHSQQQLAIRCFMCTGAEPTEPWTSPAAQQAASFADMMRGKSPLASPEPIQPLGTSLMPPPIRPKSGSNHRPSGKTPALKLITSFDNQSSNKFRFPGLKSDDRTPTNAPGVTPIAESAVADSALSPGGFGSYKLNNIQSLSQAMSSRTNTPAFNRRRLPSIGETPVDVHPPTFSRSRSYNTSNYGSTSETDDASTHGHGQETQAADSSLLTLSSARYNPAQESQSMKPSPQTAVQAPDPFAALKGLPSPAPGFMEALREHSDIRNGSRDRKPNGLQIDLVQAEEAPYDSHGLLPSGKSTSSTFNSCTSAKSPSVSGRSIDQYISSLDEANYHARKQNGRRTPGHGRRNADDASSQQGSRAINPRDLSQEARGRNEKRYIQPAKRSPSSPVPMSPEELARYHTEAEKPSDSRKKGSSRTRSRSKMRKASSRSRQRSSSRHTASRFGGDRQDVTSRGRSVERNGSSIRSPSSPLPMTLPQQEIIKADGQDDPLRLVSGDRQRLRSRHRSASRRRTERGVSAHRDESLEPRHKTSHSVPEIPQNLGSEIEQQSAGLEQLSAKVFGQEHVFTNGNTQKPGPASDDAHEMVSPTTPYVSLAERKRRELAAAELEARRLSLARNPSAPNIPFPGDLHNARSPLESPPMVSGSYFPRAPSRNKATSSKTSPGYHSGSDSSSSRSGAPLGLPATPRAMRHPKYGVNGHEVERPPSVPTIPNDYSNGPLLSDARYQGEAERIGRSMSVPAVEAHYAAAPVSPEIPMHPRFNPHLPRSRSSSRSRKMSHRRTSSGGGYVSGTSQPVTISIEETIDTAMQRRPSGVQIELIPPPPPPPILPELQHLNTPPPPPPVPLSMNATSPRESSATIDVAIDHANMGRLLPRAMTAAPALSGPENRQNNGHQRMSFEHRRNRSSNESFANKLRSLTRMRSNSRSVEPWGNTEAEWPYDDIPLTNGQGNGLESRPF